MIIRKPGKQFWQPAGSFRLVVRKFPLKFWRFRKYKYESKELVFNQITLGRVERFLTILLKPFSRCPKILRKLWDFFLKKSQNVKTKQFHFLLDTWNMVLTNLFIDYCWKTKKAQSLRFFLSKSKTIQKLKQKTEAFLWIRRLQFWRPLRTSSPAVWKSSAASPRRFKLERIFQKVTYQKVPLDT